MALRKHLDLELTKLTQLSLVSFVSSNRGRLWTGRDITHNRPNLKAREEALLKKHAR